MARDATENVEPLLEFLRRSRGFDFSGYKRSSLLRRIDKRLTAVGVHTYADYTDYLEVHPDEFLLLFNTILINVTTFFRDPMAWEALSNEVLAPLIASKGDELPIRVWSAGCASGEEAYTLAMVLAERLGLEGFLRRVKIYATDVDEEALMYARQASYSAKHVSSIPQPLLDKYFERSGQRYVFNKDLRRAVIFGRHDLIQDAPISRIDLLTCRNTIMYFNAETQTKILLRLHFALNDGGVIFLGKAEMLLTHAQLFLPIDLKRRIFRRVPKPANRERLLLLAQTNNGSDDVSADARASIELRDAAIESSPLAQIAVDTRGSLVVANERARILFELHTRDVGRPIQDLEMSYKPLELRSCIDQAYAEQRPISVKEVLRSTATGDTFLDVHILPLVQLGTLLGALITFSDVSHYKRLQNDLKHSNSELESAYEELQSTSEELETTNEELQSTVEELETTNEELQSTNEELETMNEELQSTNEELETMNDELRRRSDELNQVNAFLGSILSSLRSGVVVIDHELHVHVWNQRAEDLWGLRGEEVKGKHFFNLDIGLPIQDLRAPIRACLSGESTYQEVVLEARNRRGRSIRCHVRCTPFLGKGLGGVILLMDEMEATQPS